MRSRKAFTLIELLAVIVILAIIALIATPIILNIIERARKSAFENSAYGIIKSAENYYAESLLTEGGINEDKTFAFGENVNGLNYTLEEPHTFTYSKINDIIFRRVMVSGRYRLSIQMKGHRKNMLSFPRHYH